MLSPERVIDLFKQSGALLEGHFIYTSGRHGSRFLQAARVLQFPEFTRELCQGMADRFQNDAIDLVVGPATGGIVLAYETARCLGCRTAFSEKDGPDGMAVRRGFSIKKGARVLVVEDIVTTGGSVKKTIDHLRSRGAEVVGVSVLIDRSAGECVFDCRFEPLAALSLQSWQPDACDLCRDGVPLVEPDDIVL